MDSSDQIEFIIEKQVGETDSEEFYKLQTEGYWKSDDRVSKSEQQRGGGTDRLQRESRKSQYKINLNKQHQDWSWLRVKNLVPQKEMLKPPSKKKKVQRCDFETSLVNSRSTANDFCETKRWLKRVRRIGTLTLLILEMSLLN